MSPSTRGRGLKHDPRVIGLFTWNVALHARARIETLASPYSHPDPESPSTRGRGLKHMICSCDFRLYGVALHARARIETYWRDA